MKFIKFVNSYKTLVSVIFLFLFSFILRFIFIDSIPGNITADEADNMWSVFKIQTIGLPLFGNNWNDDSAFNTYVFHWFMSIFGQNIFGMRMASVVLTSFAVIIFFLILKKYFGIFSALLSAILFSSSFVFLNFSRSGWENAHLILYSLLAIYFLEQAKEKTSKKYLWIFLSGFFAFLCILGYHAGRIVPLVFLFYFFILWLLSLKEDKKRVFLYLRQFICWVLPAIFVLPFLPAVFTHNTRLMAVNILGEEGIFGKICLISLLIQ